MKVAEYLKNLFFFLLILQFAPPIISNITKQFTRMLEARTKVGELKIGGLIENSAPHLKYIKKFFKNPDIKGILLRFESPGGAGGSSQIIFEEIEKLKKEYPKPVVALVENVCASGAYYIACAGDHIIAPGNATIGSIGGAFRFLFQMKSFIEYHNIFYKSLKAGKFKGTGDMFVDMTPEEEALLQEVLNDAYAQFAQAVSKKRNLSLAEKDKWAEGKIFTGRQALKLGLIDALGARSDAVAKIKELGLIEGKIEWVRPPKKTGFAALFGDDENDDSTEMSLAHRVFSSFANWFGGLRIS